MNLRAGGPSGLIGGDEGEWPALRKILPIYASPSTTDDALEPHAAVNRWSSPYSQIILKADIGVKIYRNTYTKYTLGSENLKTIK
jgi:hypothetical protein